MCRIQEFMRELIYEDPTGRRTILPPTITPEFPAISNCFVPYFESCMMACTKRRSTGANRVKLLP